MRDYAAAESPDLRLLNQPNGVLDDRWWEAMAGVRYGAHDAHYPAVVMRATGLA